MEVDAEPRRIEGREMLGQQRSDRACQDVARPAGGERRVLERRDRDAPVGCRNDRLRTLQNDHLTPRHRGIAGGRGPRCVVGGEIAVRLGVAPAARA